MVKFLKRRKALVAICCVLIVAIIATVAGVLVQKNKGREVSFASIKTEDIVSTINANASVEAGSHKEYKVSTVATVNEVFVKTGDRVTTGQRLATFDTSALDSQISELGKQYNSSKASYDTSVAQAKEARANVAQLDEQIAALEMQAQAEKDLASESAGQIPAIPEEVMQRLQAALAGVTSPEQIPAVVEATLRQAVADGLISEEQMKQIIGGTSNTVNQGMGASGVEMQIAMLKLQRQVLDTSANSTISDVARGSMETNSQLLSTLKAQRDSLASGWTADFDGLISAVNIAPGSEATLLSAGIVLEGTNTLTAVINLGKYDLQKVTVGMPCKISVVNGEFDGEVSFIAPTADQPSASSGVIDSLTSSMGISGMGSLTGTTAGVRCEITIKEPDSKVVIGIDATVEIILGTKEDAVAIPVEALKMDKEGKYCFVFNEKEKIVEKRTLVIGEASDTFYEVKEGLKEGEKIATSSLGDLVDGEKVFQAAPTNKTTKK